MGDNGRLYAGVPESTIGLMRDLAACADYAVPNYTEACLLTDTPMESITPEEARVLVDAVRELGAKSVVITSAVVDGTNAVIGYDHVASETSPFRSSSSRSTSPVRATRSPRCCSAALWPVGRCSAPRLTPCAWSPSLSSATPTRRTSPPACPSRPAWT